MQIKATQKYIHIGPRKLRRVVDAIRHLPPQTAIEHLNAINNRASQVVAKLINQVLADAANNHNLNQDTLKFASIEVNQSFTFKRWQPVSRGRAHPIQKKNSHLSIVLTQVAPVTTPAATQPKTTQAPKKSKPATKPAPTKAKTTTKKPTTKTKNTKSSTKK